MFTLKHQDGDIEFELENGGFSIQDSKLYLSIETKAKDSEAFPDRFLFAVDGYPLEQIVDKLQFTIATNPEDETPNVYVYTTFHACEVIAEIEIQSNSETEILVSLNVTSEDAMYYNEKAKPNDFVGSAIIESKELEQMWLPS